MPKFYFISPSEERCITLASVREYMRENELTELEVLEAKRMKTKDFFFCSHFDTVGEKDGGCGKDCEGYKPRNGTSGRCRHHKNCYEPTSKKKIVRI